MFSEMATKVSIDDEGGGEFIVIEQFCRNESNKIAFNDAVEFNAVCEAVNLLLKDLQK